MPKAPTLSDIIPLVFVSHPRHLPKVPDGRVVVVDVAFAAGKQFNKKTLPFLNALGERLVAYVDHHEHPAWAQYQDDDRFLLVENRVAHACPELITPELVRAGGAVDHICAHADFDGMVAGIKWRLGGESPWPQADEDARAVDSPGRGHSLSDFGQRIALALEESSGMKDFSARFAVMQDIAFSLTIGHESAELRARIDDMADRARAAQRDAVALAEACGKEEAPGVFVVRLTEPVQNRIRKHLLIYGEERCPVGALYEPDANGGAWVTAATFRPDIDLALVEGFEGGRSDYRFCRASGDGQSNIDDLSRYVQRVTL